ncbi:MAG TPA: hypothetical protein VM325_03305 [Alphaproteobacteria bacterium]|nr:hypothetical protein [Alphaproteobacteria bacterium]
MAAPPPKNRHSGLRDNWPKGEKEEQLPKIVDERKVPANDDEPLIPVGAK